MIRIGVLCLGPNRLRREEFRCDQASANFHPIWVVHFEHADGRPADSSSADQQRPVPGEVRAPSLAAGIEKSRELAGLRIEPGNVRAFVEIIVRAGKREVFERRLAAVLLGDNVIEGKGELREISWDFAILAAVFGSLPDSPLQHFVHGSGLVSGFLQREDRLGL
jgi:hypothetical protein